MTTNSAPVSSVFRGPDPANTGFIADFVAETCKFEDQFFIDGDVVDLRLSTQEFTVAPATLVAISPLDEDDSYPWPDFATTIHLHPFPGIDIDEPFVIPGLCTKGGNNIIISPSTDNHFASSISHNIETKTVTVRVSLTCDHESDEDRESEHIIYLRNRLDKSMGKESSFFKAGWHKYTHASNPEGVVIVDDVLPAPLIADLRAQINALAACEPVDWHPGSKNCVRDLVHPSLYPFVRGESTLTMEGQGVLHRIADYHATLQTEGRQPTDRWGRMFEQSIYQWLPTVFRTDENGHVEIEGYLNNLDPVKYSELYRSLALMFERFLPMLEQVYSYAQKLRFVQEDMFDRLDEAEYSYRPNSQTASLKGRALRVIVKIVDYELQEPSASIEGAFHVEGMSSDHILATASYTLSRAEVMDGATLQFRRGFLDFEGQYIYNNVPQCRHWKAEEIVDEGIRPIGSVRMEEGRVVVFPNSHIHKLTTMRLREGAKVGSRRVVVFWVVDPDVEIVTTEHVEMQQGEGGMTRERALWHRLQLMEERRKHKDKFNTERKLQLCEH